MAAKKKDDAPYQIMPSATLSVCGWGAACGRSGSCKVEFAERMESQVCCMRAAAGVRCHAKVWRRADNTACAMCAHEDNGRIAQQGLTSTSLGVSSLEGTCSVLCDGTGIRKLWFSLSPPASRERFFSARAASSVAISGWSGALLAPSEGMSNGDLQQSCAIRCSCV